MGVLIGLGVFAFAVSKSPFFCTQASAQCADIEAVSDTATEITPQYFTFSQAKLVESLVDSKTVVLYFHAPWCTTCTSFEQELKGQQSQLPPEVVVLKIDFDTSSDLKKQYNVIYQHTLVLLDKEGKTKEIWIGGNLDALLDYLKKNS